MGGFYRSRLFRITVLFLAVNVIGLWKIMALLEPPSPAALRIVEFTPRDETPCETPITLRFSQPMSIPAQYHVQFADGGVAFSPDIRGKFSWADAVTLKFTPEKPLPKATQFRAVVSGSFRSLQGNLLGDDRNFLFQTPALRVVSTAQHQLSADGRATIAVEFDDAVSCDDLRSRMEIAGPDGSNISFNLRESAGRILAETGVLSSESVLLKIAHGLRGKSGPLGLEKDFSTTLSLTHTLAIHGISASWGYGVTAGSEVSISMSQPVDATQARPFVRVDPPADYSLANIYNGLQVTGPFEAGTTYTFTFLKGLRGKSGLPLPRDVARTVSIPDLPSAVRFKSQGIYVASEGNMILPIESVNIKEFDLAIERIYDNNIVHYLHERSKSNLGKPVASRTFRAEAKLNQPLTTNVELRRLLGEARRGIYEVTLRDSDDYWARDRRLLMITDLGISVKRSANDMLVWVNSLSTTAAAEGTAVAVHTRTNQKILEGVADRDGIVHFRNVRWVEDDAPMVVTVSKGEDAAFLFLTEAEVDRSSFDIGGREYCSSGYEAMLYADRGVFRPGETAYLHAILRASGTATPQSFPVLFRILRPDGRLFKEVTAALSRWGSAEAAVEIPAQSLTGEFKVDLLLPQGKTAAGSTTFLVEEFVPNRMDVEISAADGRFRKGEPVSFTVKARHLFGAPAGGRTVEARCSLIASAFTPPAWESFTFSDGSKPFAPTHIELGNGILDANGEKTFAVEIPPRIAPPSALTMVFSATVKEVGGRAVTTTIRRELDLHPAYVGLSRAADNDDIAKGEMLFRGVVVDPAGNRVPDANLDGTLHRIFWNTVLKEERGRYRYVSERVDSKIGVVELRRIGADPYFVCRPPAIGEYELRVVDRKNGASSSIPFHLGGDEDVSWAMEKPERIELAPDKTAYRPGEDARILVKSPFAGRALVTIESDRIRATRVIVMEKNTAEIIIPVEDGPETNLYVSVEVIRKTSPSSPWTICRAFGVAPLMVDRGDDRLRVEVEAPKEIRPGLPARLRFRTLNAGGKGAKAEVTVALVDEGICQLTQLKTPDPWSFFFGRRRHAVTTSDAYALLMPETGKKKEGTDSTEGGDTSGYDPRMLNPVAVKRVKTAVIRPPPIETDEEGNAEILIRIPEFTGQLRVMAVAASGRRFGSAEEKILVRQPLVVQSSLPRFLSPGDTFVVPVSVFNNTGKEGGVDVRLEGSFLLTFLSETAQHPVIPNGGEKTVSFRVRAPAIPGPIEMTVSATVNGEEARERIEIPVRPPASFRVSTGSGGVAAGETTRLDLPSGLVDGTERHTLALSPLPVLKLGKSLHFLLRYPYGCVEQTTSASFPLLYLSDVAALIGVKEVTKEKVNARVAAGIDRLLSMQTGSGGFAMWPGYPEVYPWGTLYATHFLVEARKGGYAVPKDALEPALRYIRERIVAADGMEIQEKAYGCMILALADRPDASWTERLFEERGRLPSYSRFQVAAALARLRKTEAVNAFLYSEPLPKETDEADDGGLLHSSIREAAMLLSAYLDLSPDHPNVPRLVERLERAFDEDRWSTTQANGFAAMALGKFIRRRQVNLKAYRAVVSHEGRKVAESTHRDNVVLTPRLTQGQPLSISVEGEGTLYYYWRVEGVPLKADVVERDQGLKVRRSFKTPQGTPLSLKEVPQGDLIFVEVSVEHDDPLRNVVLSDLLPAGFEIENPRLATAERLPWMAGGDWEPDRVEMRDDRLLIFSDLHGSGVKTFRYLVRAVTKGTFQLPPIEGTSMYRPEVVSVNGNGFVEVIDVPPKK